MKQETINIKGIDKARILQALYNKSHPIGMGFLQYRPGDMTLEEARELVGGKDSGDYPFASHNTGGYFDYVYGRPLKIDLSRDEFYPQGYDRDNGGDGAAARIIAQLPRE
jgi:hypothetical protein